VREGRFHIWAVRTADEGIEILTGTAAGEVDGDGHFPDGSVNGRVAARLAELARRFREFGPAGERPAGERAAEPPREFPPAAP